jgi:hypothetical protein
MSENQANGKNGKQNRSSKPAPGGPPPFRGSAARPGLVNGAISRQKHTHSHISGTIIVSANGLKAKRDNIKPPYGIPHGSGRKEICGFSKAARRRMLDYLLSIDWNLLIGESKRAAQARGVFATLTYPANYSQHFQDWKRHLDIFRKHLLRSYSPKTSVIWKLENQEYRCQKTGAEFIPHFHLAIDFKEPVDIREFRAWLSAYWYISVGSGDPKHLRAGTNAQVIYGDTGRLLSYLGKYLSKTYASKTHTGRVWGVWNKFELAPVKIYTQVAWVKLLRRVRAHGKYSKYLRNLNVLSTQGFRMFGPDLEQLLERGL